jgi:hypothetical protein
MYAPPPEAKHSKPFSITDTLSIGVDRMQRNFDLMRQQVERWRRQQLSAEAAKLTIYQAVIEGDREIRRHLARRSTRTLYFIRSICPHDNTSSINGHGGDWQLV